MAQHVSQYVMLNNVAHKELRVITRYGKEFGDNVATAVVVPTEFADVQREYPIFFRKDPESGAYSAMALMGLQQDENLYLGAKGWEADYVPGVVARGPFFIGYKRREVEGKVQNEPVVHVDLDSPRVSKTEGEAVFTAQGGNTRYLENIAALLNAINLGLEVSKPMFEAFTAANLIEPVQLEVTVNSEEQFNLTGMYTISREKLAGLDADTLFNLHRAGYLQAAFLVISSMANVQRLIDLKNRRRNQAAMAS
jgi:SapC